MFLDGCLETDLLELVQGLLVVGLIVHFVLVVDDLVEVDSGEKLVLGGLCLSI